MKKLVSQITINAHRYDSRYIQIALVILTLSLLALGASAPVGGGAGIPSSG